jgi:t-SNARE complex subunit (syntaxin)
MKSVLNKENAMFTKINSVDNVMAAFTQTIAQLDTIVTKQSANVTNLGDQRNAIDVKIQDATKEIDRASKIAAKLEALVDV